MFNEMAQNFEENTSDFCNEDLLAEKSHPNDMYGKPGYNHPWGNQAKSYFKLWERDARKLMSGGLLRF